MAAWITSPADGGQQPALARKSGRSEAGWPEHVIGETGNIETTRAWDLDGDGVPEIVPNTPGRGDVIVFKLKTGADGKGTGAFVKHTIFTFPEKQTQGHGLGCGDIAGQRTHGHCSQRRLGSPGRYVERQVDLASGFRELGWWGSSVPMLVEDVNGDGLNEIVVATATAMD